VLLEKIFSRIILKIKEHVNDGKVLGHPGFCDKWAIFQTGDGQENNLILSIDLILRV